MSCLITVSALLIFLTSFLAGKALFADMPGHDFSLFEGRCKYVVAILLIAVTSVARYYYASAYKNMAEAIVSYGERQAQVDRENWATINRTWDQ